MFARSLRDALTVYIRQFGRIAAAQGLLIVALMIVTVVVALLARQTVVALMDYMSPGGEVAPERVLGVALIVILVGGIVLLPFSVATLAATIGIADDSLAGRRVSLLRWLGLGMRRWLPVTGAIIVAVAIPVALLLAAPALVLVGLAGLAVMGVLRVIRSRNPEDSKPTPSTRVWILLAIPFSLFVLAVPTALLAVPASVLEHAGPIEAWRIAEREASGRRLTVFGTAAIAFIAYAALSALVSWLLPLAFDADSAQLLSLVFSVLLLPLVLVAVATAYRRAAGPSARTFGAAERKARAASRRAAEPGIVARVAALVVASLIVSTVVAVPSAAFADEARPSDPVATATVPEPEPEPEPEPVPVLVPDPASASDSTPATSPPQAQPSVSPLASSADASTLLVVDSKPTFRQIISYDEPHAGAPTTFVVRVEAYGNGPDADTSVPPTGDAFLYIYEISTPTGTPYGPQLATCPVAPLTPVPGESLVWQYSCTVSFPTAGKYGLISGGYNGDDLWQSVFPGGMVFDPDQRFAVGDLVKGTPTLSLSTGATNWVGNQTIPLQWSITGPSSGVTLTLARDGIPLTTLSGTSGVYNALLPANLGLSADSIDTTFTLSSAATTLWNSGSTTFTRGVTACIPVGTSGVSPGGAGTISLATPTACGSGSTAGFTPGSTVHWTVVPSDTTTRTAVHLSGSADPSLVIINGTDVSTVVDRSRALALSAEFENTCAVVTVPLSVSVDEPSNCGPPTGWGLIVTGSTTQKSNTFLAGTILHLSYTLPDANMTFTGWSGALASGASTDAKVGARVTNSGLGVTPTFSPICFPVTLAQQGAVGSGYITSSANCHLPGVYSPGNAVNGYAAGTIVAVRVIRPNINENYTASITVAQQGNPARQTNFPAYQGRSLAVSTSFVVTAPTTVSWAAGRCVLIQTVGVNANHDPNARFGNQYLYSHVSSPGCGNYSPGGVGPTGYDSSAYVALGDTVSISSSLPAGSAGDWAKLHFQGWQRAPGDPSGFTPPNQAVFQWKVTGPAGFAAYWGQEVNCQAVTVVMVPSNAFSNVQLTSEQANGCPAGTFDLADAMSVANGGATVRVSATPNSAVSQGAVYGIGYATNSYNGSTKATAAVSADATAGLSRAIPAFGATTITLYACQAINASAQLKSPADGKNYPAELSQGDFFFVSPAENCRIGGKPYWTVGSTVDVAAAPQESGYRFTGWEGKPGVVDGTMVTVSLTGNGPSLGLVANFDVSCYTLTSNYAEGVNVSPPPNCPGYPASEHKWVAGSVVTLTVDEKLMKDNITYFDGWTGGPDSASGQTAGVILSEDRAVYANFRSNTFEAQYARTTSSLAQTFVGVIAGALGGLLLATNPVTAILGIVNTVLGGIGKIAGALGASGSVLDALSSAADATQWLTNLITAPMSCVSNWSGGEGGAAGNGSSTLAGQAGRSIGKAVTKEWTRMSQGGSQSVSSTASGVVGNTLTAFQVMNSWISNLNNDPEQTWSSFTSSFTSCMAQSAYPPGT